MPQSISPVDVARHVGISPDTARGYLQDIDPTEAPRLRKRWEESRLPELAAICKSKQQRKCFNANNARLKSEEVTQ